MEITRINELQQIASEVRKDIVRMVGLARSGPIELPLMISDMLVYLYWEEMLLLAGNPSREDRDRFILGSEEGVPALYSVLARRGYYEREELWHYMRLGAMLQALPDFRRTPGIDAPVITSGTELSIASGLADSLRKKLLKSRIFCFLEDKGCTGADFMLEAKRCAEISLSNMTLIVVCKESPLTDPAKYSDECRETLTSFGWNAFEMDGNDFDSMEKVFGEADSVIGRPAAIFAKIRNGKCISFAEADPARIKKRMSIEAMDRALEELEEKSNG